MEIAEAFQFVKRLPKGSVSDLCRGFFSVCRSLAAAFLFQHKTFCILSFLAILTLSNQPQAFGYSVTLEWDRNSETNVAGYRVYYGLASRSYSATIDAANQTNATVTTLNAGQTYYFAVTAYTSDGLESDFSDEVFYTVPNRPPVTQPDSYSTAEDTSLTVIAPGVLSNDSDPDGGSLTAVVVSPPAHGVLSLNGNGSFSYVPAANYNGPDSFTYRASDGATSSSPTTVSLTVTTVNDAPSAANDSYSVAQNSTLSIAAPGLLANDSDVDGDVLSAVLVTAPSHGTLNLSANGSFTYRPNTNYNGTDSFTYRASDGTILSGTATVTLTIATVNTAPVALNDTYSVNEDSVLTIAAPGVLSNDSDAEANAITAVLLTSPAHGTLTLNANGSFTYRPATNYNGPDSFTYRATDGSLNSASASVTVNVAPVNDVPLAANDSYTVAEDSTLTVNAPGVLSNDSDVDGDALTAVLVTPPAHGTLALNANGSFTYRPATNYAGPDSFTYRANDGALNSAVATASITITAVNDPPIANNDSYSIAEDTTLTVAAPGVLANDSDAEASTLTATLLTSPAHGTLTLNANGSFTYRPATNYNGPDSFTYRANDGLLNSTAATVTINVTAVNDAPIASNDSYATPEDTALIVSAPGVLLNDSDVDGDALTAVLVGAPAHGTLSLNANGSFTYLPATNYNGPDAFTYRVTDGILNSTVATVSLTITAGNDPPVAQNDSYTATEDTTLTVNAPGVLANDTDAEGATLTASLLISPAHGTLTLNANGSFSYRPATNYNGPDSFTYRANDGVLDSSPATVTINVSAVNDAPVANSDSYTVAEDTVLTVNPPGVLSNDTDVDGDTLTAVLVTAPAHGSATLQANGSFIYRPATNYSGPDSFTYRANDGTLNSSIATVSITVTAVNDAPAANNDSYTVAGNGSLTIASPGVLANDSDVDGNVLSAVLVAAPAHGALSLNANGSFVYTPATNYSGPDSFSYQASDGALLSAAATVSISVGAINHPPLANDDTYSVSEDAVLSVAVPGVLANDSDEDGNTITASLLTSPAHGILTLNANGSFTYRPATNYNGPDTFTYRASDGSLNSAAATVTINVAAVNEAPLANNDSYTVAEDTTLAVNAPGVLANDIDPDGNPITAVLVTGPAHGTLTLNANGSLSYQPSTNYNGPDSFTYRATDGALNSAVATVSITVTAVNDAPVANNDSYAVTEDATLSISAPGILANDTDPEGSALTASLLTAPAHGTLTLNANGSFTYRPATNYNGPDSFTYRASDGALNSAAATVAILVRPENDAPIARDDSFTVGEDSILTVNAPGVLGNDTDVDGDALTAVLVTGPAHGTLTFNANGSFVYSSATNYSGPDSFTYQASDGSLTSPAATVTINITALNDPPVANNDTFTAIENTSLTVGAPGVLGNDEDPDRDVLSAIMVTPPAHGRLTLNTDGSFVYVPETNYNGADVFTYLCSDGRTTSSVATVTISVALVQRPPVARDDLFITAEENPVFISAPGVLGNDNDPDGDSLIAVLVSGPSHGILTFNANGSFLYTPNTNYSGTDTFVYRATDGSLSSTNATVTISITPVNDAPIAGDDAYTLQQNTALVIAAPGVLANDYDPDGDPITAVVGRPPAHGTLSFNANGSFTYSPAANYSGPDSFTYRVSDRTLVSLNATVSLTVTGPAPAPLVARNDTFDTVENAPLIVPPEGGLLTNDSAGPDPVIVMLSQWPANGSLVLSNTGGFIYVPNTNFNGGDQFSYCITDGRSTSGVATVTIAVESLPHGPIPCDGCFAAIDELLARRGAQFQSVVKARASMRTNLNCVDAGLATLAAIAGAARLTPDTELVTAVRAAATCLRANLQVEIAAQQAAVNGMLPSRWLSSASNQLYQSNLKLAAIQSTSTLLVQARALVGIGKSGDRVDKFIAAGTPLPTTLSNRVLECTFTTPRPTVKETLRFDGQLFTLSDASGALVASGSYDFSAVAWNTATLQLTFSDSTIQTFTIIFANGRGRIIGTQARGVCLLR